MKRNFSIFTQNISDMTAEQFKALTQVKENTQVEYKACTEEISESLYESVCSFLNHSGGHILLGVTNSGKIKGVNPEKVETLKSNIITCINNSELFLPCPYFEPKSLDVEGKKVIYLAIPCGQYVYRYKGRYWDRNGDADLDVTDQPELLLSIFERKNPHLFEERIVNGLTMEHFDSETFTYCRNILSVIKPGHAWLQMSDEDVLASTKLAVKDQSTGQMMFKYAALILFGTEDAITDFMPRYRFEALFHMCTYEEYNDSTKLKNRYDDRITMRYNLIKVYAELARFTERYLPNKFYLPEGTTRREDLRWALFREIVANLCVHTDFSSGYACFYHVFKDRVVTRNPTRLLPEIPEGELTLQELGNYTKNPLLVRVFHELTFVEDLGSGTRNILQYAPLYYENYKVEINNGSQFIFSIIYMEVAVIEENGSQGSEILAVKGENGSQETGILAVKGENGSHKSSELEEDELNIILYPESARKKTIAKKRKRHQGIISLIKSNPQITVEEIADKLDAGTRTIYRDIDELGNIISFVGSGKNGHWVISTGKPKK